MRSQILSKFVMVALIGFGATASAETKPATSAKPAKVTTPAAADESGAGATTTELEQRLDAIAGEVRELADDASKNVSAEAEKTTADAKTKLQERLDDIQRDMAQARDQFAAATGEAENSVRADLSRMLRDLAGKIDQTKKDLEAGEQADAGKGRVVSSKTAARKLDAAKGKVAANEEPSEDPATAK
jgi:TolA-binding protein